MSIVFNPIPFAKGDPIRTDVTKTYHLGQIEVFLLDHPEGHTQAAITTPTRFTISEPQRLHHIAHVRGKNQTKTPYVNE